MGLLQRKRFLDNSLSISILAKISKGNVRTLTDKMVLTI